MGIRSIMITERLVALVLLYHVKSVEETDKMVEKVEYSEMYWLRFPLGERISFASAGQFVSSKNPVHSRRRLDTAVLLLGCEGEMPLAQEERRFILRRGNFQILLPGMEHYGTAPASAGQSHFWCHFTLPEGSEILSAEEGELVSTEGRWALLPEFGRIENEEKYVILFHQLIDAAYWGGLREELRQEICDAYLKILLDGLSGDYLQEADREREPKKSRRAIVSRVREWIRGHVDEPLTVARLAEEFQYNADYLTKMVKGETGRSLVEEIQSIRMEEAKKLLVTSGLRVCEIAFAVGFEDEKYFMRTFKKSENVTPSEYRQAHFRTHTNVK